MCFIVSWSERMSDATPSACGRQSQQKRRPLVAVDTIEERHLCASCKEILQRPYQLYCGHHLCYYCLDDIFSEGEPAKCPKSTPDDPCEDLFRKDIFLDVHVLKEISNQRVYCPNSEQGCPVVARRKDILEHAENCDYQIVPCQYPECNEQITKIDFEKHLSNCPFVPILCRKCQEMLPKIKLEEHEDQECPEIIVGCPYKCTTASMKRRHLKEHLDTCSLKPRSCKFDFVGCEYCGTEMEMEAHLQEAAVQHTYLVAHESRREHNNRLKSFEEMIEATGKKINSLSVELEQLNTKINSLTTDVAGVVKQVMELPRKEILEEHSRDITTLTERVETLFVQMREISSIGTISTQFGNLNQMSERVTRRLNDQERRIDSHNDKLAALDLKHQILESANYDGTMVWKIGEYARRKQDAVDGRTISLYSQPFFTGRFGYKMYLRVYLNGDGVGRGSHLSLFISIMQGEFDSILAWPFQHEVRFFLLDQSQSGHKRHIKESFIPDPALPSFQRPTSQMGVASGRPLFVSHSDLESPNRNYIVDDTLFIRCTVSTSGLSH